jgi:2-(1,2-epoxy-1,2-dihydrophenyl)acetyl-CoA isomerase
MIVAAQAQLALIVSGYPEGVIARGRGRDVSALIWKAVDDAEFAATVEQLAARLAKAPTDGLARMKRVLDASWGNTLDRQLDLERDVQREAGRSPDYAEGVRAFMEKRPPRFRGRFG